jgi:hypothetical protein
MLMKVRFSDAELLIPAIKLEVVSIFLEAGTAKRL